MTCPSCGSSKVIGRVLADRKLFMDCLSCHSGWPAEEKEGPLATAVGMIQAINERREIRELERLWRL